MRFGIKRQEARIDFQKPDMKSLQRDLQTTQHSLNNWDEVNLNSFQGVYADGCIGTPISSASRIAETAINHPPQSRGDPELFPPRDHSIPNAAPKLAAAQSREMQRQLLLTNGLNQENSEVGKLASKVKSLFLRSIPQPLCY